MEKCHIFCTMATKSCKEEVLALILTLSIHHMESKLYLLCDSETSKFIKSCPIQIKIKIIYHIELDEYSNMNRREMTRKGLWLKFQMKKAYILQKSLEKEDYALFLDSDVFVLSEIMIDKSKELGVSPHYINDSKAKKFGYYNGGTLFASNIKVCDLWLSESERSRYFDQACIEELPKHYSYFEFPEECNIMRWRFDFHRMNINDLISKFSFSDSYLRYEGRKIQYLHTHFREMNQLNKLVIPMMEKNKMWKELLIIDRIKGRWKLQIPKQPRRGIYFHKDDSFRELAMLKAEEHPEHLEIERIDENHCLFSRRIVLYDRPTLRWYEDKLKEYPLFLLGNGSNDVEGEELTRKGVNWKNWIFWPRHPRMVKKILEEKGILEWKDRDIESIFIGNICTKEQQKGRGGNWGEVIQEFSLINGGKYKYTNEEYLLLLRRSKFGLCMRGFGSKCHREVELMAFGTIPVATKEVSMDYADPLIEGEHYLRVSRVEDWNYVINIGEEKWKEMSSKCKKWYSKNLFYIL